MKVKVWQIGLRGIDMDSKKFVSEVEYFTVAGDILQAGDDIIKKRGWTEGMLVSICPIEEAVQ
jgi:hypothetical protein